MIRVLASYLKYGTGSHDLDHCTCVDLVSAYDLSLRIPS